MTPLPSFVPESLGGIALLIMLALIVLRWSGNLRYEAKGRLLERQIRYMLLVFLVLGLSLPAAIDRYQPTPWTEMIDPMIVLAFCTVMLLIQFIALIRFCLKDSN